MDCMQWSGDRNGHAFLQTNAPCRTTHETLFEWFNVRLQKYDYIDKVHRLKRVKESQRKNNARNPEG